MKFPGFRESGSRTLLIPSTGRCGPACARKVLQAGAASWHDLNHITQGALMPIGEIAGEALGGILRVTGRLLFELVVEVMIRGTGHVLIRIVRPRSEPGDTASAIAGLAFWAAVGAGGYFIYRASAG